MRRSSLLLALACAVALFVPRPGQAGAAKPRRIVSLNLCADELVVALADRANIASLTYLARDPAGSTVTQAAAGIPVNYGLAEEIVPLAPDLVIAGAFTTRTTVRLLQRLGIPVLELSVPATPEAAAAQIRAVAMRIGEPQRGEDLARQLEAGLAALPQPPTRPPGAVVVRPNGFTAGAGSMADALMERAGLDNLARRHPTDRMGQWSVEEIVTAQPDVLITDAAPGRPPSLAHEVLRHPALVASTARRVSVPGRLWACAGPELVDAARLLAAGARGDQP